MRGSAAPPVGERHVASARCWTVGPTPVTPTLLTRRQALRVLAGHAHEPPANEMTSGGTVRVPAGETAAFVASTMLPTRRRSRRCSFDRSVFLASAVLGSSPGFAPYG